MDHISQNTVIPRQLPNKDELLLAISNVSRGSSPVDTFGISNTFIFESRQLLVNSISLYETGYVDAAYYSLREAIEISTTIMYFNELSQKQRDDFIRKWKTKQHIDGYKTMLRDCESWGNNCSDLIHTIKSFKSQLIDLKKQLDKKVHKQGFDTFYSTFNVLKSEQEHNKRLQVETKEFIGYFKKTTGAVAIINLIFDPFPMLLLDEEIFYRIQLISEPFDPDFVNTYLGPYHIHKYKETELYRSVYKDVMNDYEKMNEPVYWARNIVPLIYPSELDKYAIQSHLLSKECKICISLFIECPVLMKIQVENDIVPYVRAHDPPLLSSSFPYEIISSKDKLSNVKIDDDYYSSMTIGGYHFILCHSEPLDSNKLNRLEAVIDSSSYLAMNKSG